MREVERTLEISGRADDFRQSLIAKIGAWSLDHRGQKPVMTEIFADLLRKLRDAYYERHKKTITKGIHDLVMLLSGNEGHLSADARTRADTALRDADHALRLHAGVCARSGRRAGLDALPLMRLDKLAGVRARVPCPCAVSCVRACDALVACVAGRWRRRAEDAEGSVPAGPRAERRSR